MLLSCVCNVSNPPTVELKPLAVIELFTNKLLVPGLNTKPPLSTCI